MWFMSSALVLTWLELIVKFGTALLILPIATALLTPAELAFYLFINSILALSYLAEGGLNKVILRIFGYFNNGHATVPKSRPNDLGPITLKGPNYRSIGHLVQSTLPVYLLISIVTFLLAYLLGGHLANNLVNNQENFILAKVSLLLVSIFSGVYVFQLRYVGFLHGLNKIAKQKKIEIGFGLVRLILILSALVLGGGVLGVSIGMLLSVLLSCSLYRRLWIRSFVKNEFKNHLRYDKDLIIEIAPVALKQALMAWGGYLIYYGSSVIVVQFHDINLVASYLLTIQVIFLLNAICQAPAHSWYPSLVEAVSIGNIARYKTLLVRTLLISLAVYSAGCLVLAAFGNDVLVFLGSETRFLSGNLMYLLILIYLLELNHVIHSIFYTASNLVPFVMPSLFSGLAIVLLGYWAVQNYGVFGVAFVQLSVQLLFNNWYPVWLNYRVVYKQAWSKIV